MPQLWREGGWLVLFLSNQLILWNYAIRQLGGVRTNIYVYGQPVVTVIGSALFLHEVITPQLLLGIVLSMAGVILSGLPSKKQ